MKVKIFKKDKIDINKELEILKANNVEIVDENPDYIISFGGDGTILKASKDALKYNAPIIAVNFGKIAYMADIESKNFEKVLKSVINKKHKLSKRYLLKCNINNKIYYALNEIVFKYDLLGELSLYEENQKISDFRADGLIISTPTGSTAYAMSAGGSIIHPKVKALNVVAIASHNIGTRAIVLPAVNLKVESKSRIFIDGKETEKAKLVYVSYSKKYISLVEEIDKNYYNMLKIKLDWKG